MCSKILITGGAGYIGSHFAHYLAEKRDTKSGIIIFDNLTTGNRSAVDGFDLVKGDVRNASDLQKVFDSSSITHVFHFASSCYVGESFESPGAYFDNNIVGAINLLEKMNSFNCKKIIFSSSCAVYGLSPGTEIDEKTRKTPINPYGETKLIIEKLIDWYSKIHDFSAVCLRYFNAAGAAYGIGEEHDPETHLIPAAINAALFKKEKLKINGVNFPTKDGTCVRDYIHVLDLASAHFLAMKYLDTGNPSIACNIGSGLGVSILEVLKEVERHTGEIVPVEFCEARKGDPPSLVANFSYANKLLGWSPVFNISDSISSAVTWHKQLVPRK